jgi:predicted nuclease of predicted toxin-antitoxin system
LKLLADANVAASTVRELRAQKEDVVSVAEIHEFALPDSAIVERARREGRTIVTFDQDFGRLLAMEGASTPSAIILRLENQTPAYVTPRLLAALERHVDALGEGAIVVVHDGHVRVRSLPIQR